MPDRTDAVTISVEVGLAGLVKKIAVHSIEVIAAFRSPSGGVSKV